MVTYKSKRVNKFEIDFTDSLPPVRYYDNSKSQAVRIALGQDRLDIKQPSQLYRLATCG